jgi:hypothetical protein
MLSVLKRHAIQVLVAAGHLHVEVVRSVGVAERTVRRVAKEAAAQYPAQEVLRGHGTRSSPLR